MRTENAWFFQVDRETAERFRRVCVITGRSPQRTLRALMARYIKQNTERILDSVDMDGPQDPAEIAAETLDKIQDMRLEGVDCEAMEAIVALCFEDMAPGRRVELKDALGARGLSLVKYSAPPGEEQGRYYHALAVAVNEQAIRDVTGITKYSRALRAHPDFIRDSVATIRGKSARVVIMRLK